MNILILSGKFGMGHWSASVSLQEQIAARFPTARVELVEFYAYALPHAHEPMYKAFSLLVTHGGSIFNTFHRLTEEMQTPALPRFPPVMVDKLAELVDSRAPRAIIATHPVCAQIVSRYKEKYDSDLPLITCLTDLTIHSEWLCPGTDCYMVGTPALKLALLEQGVDATRILVTGIPVRSVFTKRTRGTPGETRNLLVMGGGLGLLPRQDSFYQALDALPQVETAVLTGTNHRLFRRLAGRYRHLRPVGYTQHVHRYMEQADLMLTKPGGITIFEAIGMELPLLVWSPTLRQETENALFLQSSGTGRIAPRNPAGCLSVLRELIYDNAALAAMATGMSALKKQMEADALCTWLAKRLQGVCA